MIPLPTVRDIGIILLLLLVAGRPLVAQDVSYLDDEKMRAKLQKHLERLENLGQAVPPKDLQRQLEQAPRVAKADLIPRREVELPLPRLYEQVVPSVLMIGRLYLCGKCEHRHIGVASGFVLTTNGVAATAYHVMDQEVADTRALGAMTRDGRFYPITGVVAAHAAEDVALIRLGGAGDLVPLPMASPPPVGSAVVVISHPESSFYVMTDGIVSRYARHDCKKHRNARYMCITADFAKGSSGAPVVDLMGNAVGLVTRTQCVIRACAPSATIMDMVTSP